MTMSAGVRRRARQADDSGAVAKLGRTGYAAKAFLYVIVGLLVLRLAFGGSAEEASAQGALDVLAHQPMGSWLVGAAGIGLAGYALWRLALVVIGSTDDDASLPPWVQRAGWLVSAIGNGVLAFLAVRQALGGGTASDGGQRSGTWFSLPGGVVLVGFAGLAVIAVGISQGRKAATGSWADHLDFGGSTSRQRSTTRALGTAGHAGRALAWAITGVFLLQSAITFDPDEPVGLDAALRELQQASWGLPVLLAVGIGLTAYGLWCAAVTLWGDPGA